MRPAFLIATCLLFSIILGAHESSGRYTAPHQQRALEIFRTVVAMRTAAGHGQVPKMANYLAEQFRTGGFPASDVHGLAATIRAAGSHEVRMIRKHRAPPHCTRRITRPRGVADDGGARLSEFD